MTQNERIVEYLQTHQGITTKEAMLKLGVYRLASRIHDLREEGYRFATLKREEPNRYGEVTRFTEYRLIKEDEYESI